MKQNTTPILPIEILMPFENVQRIEFIFKRLNTNNYNNDLYRSYPALLHKVYEGSDIPVSEQTSESFIVQVPFTEEETLSLPVGPLHMDTRIVLSDGSVPETQIVKINVTATLFEEVYQNDQS